MPKKKLTTNRAEMILSAIIDSYIEEGTPIGSKKLASNERFDLSPATIRNVMSDLEELGFIASPTHPLEEYLLQKGIASSLILYYSFNHWIKMSTPP